MPPGPRLTVALDDTPTPRYGPCVEGAGIHHNPSPGPAGEKFVYGHAWVCLAALAPIAQCVAQSTAYEVSCVDADEHSRQRPFRFLNGHWWKGWQLKPYALTHSPFREVLLLDADCYPIDDLDELRALAGAGGWISVAARDRCD